MVYERSRGAVAEIDADRRDEQPADIRAQTRRKPFL
jgi:hypothetical protein